MWDKKVFAPGLVLKTRYWSGSIFFVDVFVSAPRTPLEESIIGFQVDKLIDAIQGEAKIKITVYEHDQGQVRGSKTINQSFIRSISQSLDPSIDQSIDQSLTL